MNSRRILVIKLGALGDFVQALGPLQAIRNHHPDQEIILLTTRPFEELARASGAVDTIWIDDRPRFYQIGKWWALRQRLQAGEFERVYDLQTSDRSSAYFKLFGNPPPEWSGIAQGCSHPHANPKRDFMHTQDRQRDQLQMAGIDDVPPTDLSFIKADLTRFSLPDVYALLVPGGAPHRPKKRWPTNKYGEMAQHLARQGITPVVLGMATEQALARTICDMAPGTLDLTGQTSLLDIAAIAASAKVAIGNDTGPMHLIAASGCPSVVLFSDDSDPALCAPRGAQTTILRQGNLAQLSFEDVAASLDLENHR